MLLCTIFELQIELCAGFFVVYYTPAPKLDSELTWDEMLHTQRNWHQDLGVKANAECLDVNSLMPFQWEPKPPVVVCC